MRIKDRTWRDIKISMFWITMFALISASAALWFLLQQYQEVSGELDICRHNFEEWTKQIKNGKIILELENE